MISVTFSLIAAFMSLLGGIVGRLFWEPKLTVTVAPQISAVTALAATFCSQFTKAPARGAHGASAVLLRSMLSLP